MGGHKVKKSVLTHTPMLCQEDKGYCLKIVLLNFTQSSVKFQLRFERLLPGRPYNSMQNQYRVKDQKNVEIIERMINMCYFCCLELTRSKSG